MLCWILLGAMCSMRLCEPSRGAAGWSSSCVPRRIPSVKVNYLLLKNIEISGLQISDYRKGRRHDGGCYAEDGWFSAGKLVLEVVHIHWTAQPMRWRQCAIGEQRAEVVLTVREA